MDTQSEKAVWVVVGALVGLASAAFWHRLGGTTVAVADPAPEPPADLSRPVSDKQRAASQRTARDLNGKRVRCSVCGLETTRGPMTGHQRATGHEGTVNA